MEQKQGGNNDNEHEAAGEETTRHAALPTTYDSRTAERGEASEQDQDDSKIARRRADTSEVSPSGPSAKRFKTIPVDAVEGKKQADVKGARTPAIVTETNLQPKGSQDSQDLVQKQTNNQKLPASVYGKREDDSGSISPSSDLSSGSGSNSQRRFEAASPVGGSRYTQEVPPAPPSTPASNTSALKMEPGLATPLPLREGVRNAYKLEQQQLLSEGAVTPAPKRADISSSGRVLHMSEDFSEWAVGDRYEMVRILGRGSYGEVAQAVDKYAGRPDAYVAIKRILSPFDQEIDAIRLYREIHILRRLRGHNCIINLLDIVQPPTDDPDDFHDLYLVFECE